MRQAELARLDAWDDQLKRLRSQHAGRVQEIGELPEASAAEPALVAARASVDTRLHAIDGAFTAAEARIQQRRQRLASLHGSIPRKQFERQEADAAGARTAITGHLSTIDQGLRALETEVFGYRRASSEHLASISTPPSEEH